MIKIIKLLQKKNDLRLQSYHQEIDWLCNHIDFKTHSRERPLCIFDYGCSGGYFLDIFKEKLNDIPLLLKGDDKSNPAIKILKEKNYYISLSDIIVENLSFDIVILRGVIEHVPDFRGLFQSLSQILTKGGYLFITATPNGSSPCATLYRHNWVQHHYPSHIQHFSSHHLDYLAALNNLIRVDSIDLYSDSPYKKDTDIETFCDSIQQGTIRYTNHCQDNLNSLKHAFFESMLTILYQYKY